MKVNAQLARSVGHYVRLPPQITQFEREYLGRVNSIARVFFALHVPVLTLIAFANHTWPLLALVLSALCAAGPFYASSLFASPRGTSLVSGFAATCMGGLLVHFGQGPMQIEMHFYFFVVIALLAIFGNPAAVLVAAATVVLHHGLPFVLVPRSVFNYEASAVVVVVHGVFVALETVAACFMARSFFDSVIRLETKVQERTSELARRTRDMALLLDNVGQGFVGVSVTGEIAPGQSATLTRWLGEPLPGEPLWDYVGRADASAAAWLKLGWESLAEEFFPLELVVDQLPRRVKARDRVLSLEYRTVFAGARLEQIVVIFSDVTGAVERDRLEEERSETAALFERLLHDREGLVEFLSEANDRLQAIAHPAAPLPLKDLRRHLHTLKGSCAFFDLKSMARHCHELESRLEESPELSPDHDLRELEGRWQALTSTVGALLGSGPQRIEITPEEHRELRTALEQGESRSEILRQVDALLLESMTERLERIGAQARFLARRLGKGDIEVAIDAHGLRLPRSALGPFWAAMTHVVRNALDHGLERPDERLRLGKPEAGTLTLRAAIEGDELVIAVADDGAGIDWDAVRAHAAAHGLAHATPGDLEEALFADGLSSKEQVTEVSGRGVGMGAVRAAVLEREGRVSIASVQGKGCRFEARFPLDGVAARGLSARGPSLADPSGAWATCAPAPGRSPVARLR